MQSSAARSKTEDDMYWKAHGGIPIARARAELYLLAHKVIPTSQSTLQAGSAECGTERSAAGIFQDAQKMLNFILSILSITTNRAAMPLLAALGVFIAASVPAFAADAFAVGCNHYKQGKFPLAKAFFVKAVQDEPTSIAAHYQLANTYFQLGEYDNSIFQYNACLKLNPDNRMRAFCVSAMSQIQNLKRTNANKVASSSTADSTVKHY